MKRNFQFSIFNFQFKQKGFTLIELLIVIAIIGILSTVLMVNFIGIRERARDARRKSDLRQIQQALELYKSDVNSYPDTSVFGGSCNGAFANGNTTYMSKVPCDPQGSTYQYLFNTPSAGLYTIYACLENPNDSDPHNVPNSYCGQNKQTFTLTPDQ